MRSTMLLGLVLCVSGCFDVTVTNNWSGSGSGTAVCAAYVATPTTAYPSYDYSMTFDVLAASSSDTVQFDHTAHHLTAGSYLWVSCTLNEGIRSTTLRGFCDVVDPERRDFLNMTINSDASVTCLEGVSPPV